MRLQTKLHGVEQDKTQLETELEHKKTLLSDAQMRAQMYERTVGITADRHVDHLVKQANDRCQAQVDMMNQQIESLRTQLEDRSREVKSITTRYTELQRSREALLVDKSETINQLSRSLEDSQRHCQMLMAKNDGQTEVRLHSRIRELSDQVDEMHKTIGQLEKRCVVTIKNIIKHLLLYVFLCVVCTRPTATWTRWRALSMTPATPLSALLLAILPQTNRPCKTLKFDCKTSSNDALATNRNCALNSSSTKNDCTKTIWKYTI